MFKTIFAALLLAASTTLLAQAPQGERRLEQRCAKAKDPKLCEERHEKLKAAHSKARRLFAYSILYLFALFCALLAQSGFSALSGM